MDRPQDIHPPRWSLQLLRFFIKEQYVEEIEGDLEEEYRDNLEQHPFKKVRRLYNLGVFKLIMDPVLVRPISGTQKLNFYGMLQHNLLITLRGFKRHKTTFLINLIGLSTGLAAALLIFLWVSDERSVDTFHEKDDQLYWVMANFSINDDVRTWNYTSGKLANAMLEEFPEVEDAVRVGNHFFSPRGALSYDNNHFEAKGLFASDNFFQVMSYHLVLGNAKDILQKKESVAISEELAIKVFGSIDKAIGNTIEWENTLFTKTFAVAGVFQSIPPNASKYFDIVLNYQNLVDADEWADHWNGGYAQTYLVLKEGTDIKTFNEKIADYLDEKTDSDLFELFVQQYSKNYLYGQYKSGVQTGGRIENVRLFTFIAIFILFIACINFMNLSTAQASKRMREVGIKKAIGANRNSLVIQFLGESVLLAFISLIIAIGLVVLVLPQFNLITGKGLEFNLAEYIQTSLIIVLITGLLAGSYPAFYLSGFKPVMVLKGRLTNIRGEEWIRKGLVVIQFSLSIIFIIAVIVINKQIEFTQNQELGYQRQDVITFRQRGPEYTDPQPFFTELMKIPGVVNAANMNGDFLSGDDNNGGFSWKEGEDDNKHLFMSPKVGYNVIETLGLEIIAGRSYSREFSDNPGKIILNESAVKFMGLENPVGTKLIYGGSRTMEIIGVVRDFQYGSLHQEIEPLIFQFRLRGKQFLIKLRPGSETQTIQEIEKVFKVFNPKYNFNVSFLEDDYIELYDTENRVAVLSNYMAGIAIIISCLGLFGLAAFTAERRTKEIGIRKILGASQTVIIRLLSGSFTKILVISILIALPMGYFLVAKWLQNFAYSIQLEWWFFAIAGLTALVIAWLTVSFQTFKAARINPAECLRNE